MRPEIAVHALLRLDPRDLRPERGAWPGWLKTALQRAPWVVVRRAPPHPSLLAVGVRGTQRTQRCAAWLAPAAVREAVSPLQLAVCRDWRGSRRCAHIPALAALAPVESIMRRLDLQSRWGPAGSVGFELASGVPAATARSDLDLILTCARPLERERARALLAALARLAARVDVLLETPHGALALAEYAHGAGPFLLRTPAGPRLRADPWVCGAA